MNMKVLSIMNPKGGAGKTISSVNLAYGLENRGKKVLLIDTDPRNAISTYLNIKNNNTLNTLIEEYYKTFRIEKEKYINTKNGIDIIIADKKLLQLEMFFVSHSDNQAIFNIFESIMDILKNDYDYIIIDTEGSINNTIRGILNATDYIISPGKCSLIDTNGLTDLIEMYLIGKRNNPRLELKKVFLVQVEEKTKVFSDAVKEYNEFFNSEDAKSLNIKSNVFSKFYIRKDSNINNAMLKNLDVFNFKKSTASAIDYKNIVDELLEEIE